MSHSVIIAIIIWCILNAKRTKRNGMKYAGNNNAKYINISL